MCKETKLYLIISMLYFVLHIWPVLKASNVQSYLQVLDNQGHNQTERTSTSIFGKPSSPARPLHRLQTRSVNSLWQRRFPCKGLQSSHYTGKEERLSSCLQQSGFWVLVLAAFASASHQECRIRSWWDFSRKSGGGRIFHNSSPACYRDEQISLNEPVWFGLFDNW